MSTAVARNSPVDAWLTGAAAARALGVGDKRAVKRLAAAGLIAVRPLPTVQARYSAADVQRLAQRQMKGRS
jgi:hypothetical protein